MSYADELRCYAGSALSSQTPLYLLRVRDDGASVYMSAQPVECERCRVASMLLVVRDVATLCLHCAARAR